MVCSGSGGEDELRHSDSNRSKRLKLPKEFSNGCSLVNHAAVPRRLRSAIKKRNHESISSPFPGNQKLNQVSNGVGRLKKDEKKCKLNSHNTQGIPDKSMNKEILGPITEVEQEVAETLYALAAMLPDTRLCKDACDNKQQGGKSTPSPELDSSVPSNNVLQKEKEIRTISPQFTGEALKQPSNGEETIKFQNSSEDQLDRHRPVNTELPISVNADNCKVKFSPAAFIVKQEQATKQISDTNVVSTAWSELHLPPWISQQSELERTPAGREKLNIGLNQVAIYGTKTEVENKSKENQSSGLLWPGLNPTGPCSSNMLNPSLELYGVKFPEWFGNNGFTSQTQPPDNSAEKNVRAPAVLKNSWKKCCTHVHLSRLIKVLGKSEREDKVLLQPTAQSTQTIGSKQGVHATDGSLRNYSHTVFSEKTTDELRNALLLHKKLLQEQQQTLPKQNPEFLSFPTKTGQTVDASKPLLTSENQPLAFLLPRNHYSSTSFGHHSSTSAAQQVLLPPPYVGPVTDATVQPRLQLHREEIPKWPTQQVGASHIPAWQNGHFQSSQTMFPSSRSSLDMLAFKHNPISLEQQRLPISSSLSASRVSREQYYHLPDGFEGNGRSRLYPNNIQALQMLCNGHL